MNESNDPQNWLGSKFTVSDLHGKIVDYVIRSEGHLYIGEGKLIAVSKGNLMRVRIQYEQELAKDQTSCTVMAWIIMGSDAEKLVRNPPGAKNPFSFKM